MGDDFRARTRRSLENAIGAGVAAEDRATAITEVVDLMEQLRTTQTRQQAILKKALDVPIFTGDKEKDKVSPQEFISRAKATRRATECSEQEILEYAMMRLQGDAWIWINNAQEADLAWTADWTQFQTQFLTRWVESATVASQVELRNSLKQNAKEAVQKFWDRCFNVMMRIERANQPARTYAELENIIKGNALFHFLSGLRPELRVVVTSLGCDTVENALANAIKAEHAEQNRKKESPVYAVEEAPVAAVARKPGGRGRGRGRGGRNGFQTRTFNGNCYHCQQYGHRAAFCPQKATQPKTVQAVQEASGEAAVAAAVATPAPGNASLLAWNSVSQE